jgi:hypothetical protein
VIADPGNVAYAVEPEWRRFYRSTPAHATLRLDGQDQAEQWGPFLWGSRAEAEILRVEKDRDGRPLSVTARHDGYRRLRPPLEHRRTVTLEADGLHVHDVVDGADTVEIEHVLHLGPEVELELSGTVASLAWRSGAERRGAHLLLDPNLRWTAHRGELEPALGWYSPRFGVRTATWALRGWGRVVRPIELDLRLRLGGQR